MSTEEKQGSSAHGVLKKEGSVRTDLYCHECTHDFIALIDYDLDGDHVIECPHCRHEHCRTIKNGVVTGERWSSRTQREGFRVPPQHVWKAKDRPVVTGSATAFMRDRWFNRSDLQ